jgi:hypothetical protein
MSPEQAQGRADIDARSDIYSLGIVAFELLSGSRPFSGGSLIESLTERLIRDAKPIGSLVAGVPSDIGLAIDRCLQRDPANRWPDAKSLREALLPYDEDFDESLPARLIRVSVIMGAMSVLIFGYATAYSILDPDFQMPFRGIGILIGGGITTTIVATFALLGLRSQGLKAGAIFRKAVQQPRWWRSWYPRAFRRPGDVWSRLPKELRRFRIYRGLMQMSAFGILLPSQLLFRRSPAILLMVWLVQIAFMVLVLVQRHRATQFVRGKTSATAAEASAILTTSTWGVSAWRRSPASNLLDSHEHKRRPSGPTPADEVPASERPTQM